MSIELGYPDPAAERELLIVRRSSRAHSDARALRGRGDPRRVAARGCGRARRAGVARLRAGTARCVARYAAAAPRALQRGLSPRAGLLLMAASRAWALLAGRPMVLPEDVQAVFPAVAAHRLAGSARAGGAQSQALLRAVPLPLATSRPAGRSLRVHRPCRSELGFALASAPVALASCATSTSSCCVTAASTSCRRGGALH